jgi:hypothetical protein
MRFEDAPRPPAKGSFAAERGQLALRLEQLRSRIRDTDWSDPDLLARAGTICLELGQRDEAVTLFERVLFLDRNNAYARAMLLDNCSSEEIRRMQLPAASRSVQREMGEPFRYAVRGEGKWVLIVGSVVFSVAFTALDWLRHYSLLGVMFGVPLFLLTAGYLMHYLASVIRSSAAGRAEAPDWPMWDFGQYGMAIAVICVGVVPLLPAIAWAFMAPMLFNVGPVAHFAGTGLLAVPGLLVLPMIVLVTLVRRSVADALSPAFVLGSICRAGREYWAAALIWLATTGVAAVIVCLFLHIPLFGGALSTAFVIYGLVVGARALGTAYQSRQEELGW